MSLLHVVPATLLPSISPSQQLAGTKVLIGLAVAACFAGYWKRFRCVVVATVVMIIMMFIILMVMLMVILLRVFRWSALKNRRITFK